MSIIHNWRQEMEQKQQPTGFQNILRVASHMFLKPSDD
jgi:hypothetical protein